MKRNILLALLLLTVALTACRHHQELSVMTYNVRHCAGMDLVVDYDRTAAVITQRQPDIVALQELKKHFTVLSAGEPSYPADEPVDCLDYIAIFKAVKAEVLESVVVNEPEASDHRPVVVRMRVQ